MTHRETSGSGTLDQDFIGSVEVPNKPIGHSDASRVGKKSIEMPLPDMPVAMNPEDPAHDLPERYLKWKSAFLESAQRALNRIGIKNARVIDCRSLKHWDVSLFVKGEAQHPQNKLEDTKWNDAHRRHPGFFDQEGADEKDYVILVQFESAGGPEPMRIRKTTP